MFIERVQSRAEQRAETRANVLASAERLFREQGFDGTTIRQVAAAAGVSTGTVMAIGDKDRLLIEVFDTWIAAVHRNRESLQLRGSRDDVADAVTTLVTPFLRYFDRDRALSRQYAAIVVRGKHRSQIFDQLAVELVSEITIILLAAGIPEGYAEGSARTIYFAYLGIILAGPNRASAEESVIEALREVIAHVIPSTTEETRP